jgi:Mg2+ and Co2+ transporter CorA
LPDAVLEGLVDPPQHKVQARPLFRLDDSALHFRLLIPVIDDPQDVLYLQEVHIAAVGDNGVTVRKVPEGGYLAANLNGSRESFERHGRDTVGDMVFEVVASVARRYRDLVEALVREIEQVEDHLEDDAQGEEWSTSRVRDRLRELRREILHVRRSLAPTRDAVQAISNDSLEAPGVEVFPSRIERAFVTVHEELVGVSDSLEMCRELIASIRDYNEAKIATEQNNVMKVLTITASLLLIPTFVVGMFGQNFDNLPWQHWEHGFWWATGLIAAITIGQLAFFRHMGWFVRE